MKRLLGLILFCSVIVCCLMLTSAATIYYNENGSDRIPFESVQEKLPVKINIFDLEIFPPSSGVQFYRDGIVFLGLSKNYAKMVPSHVSFGTLQAYYALSGDSTLRDPKVFSPGFKFSYPCDAISFNMSYDKMWFTAKDKAGKYYKIFVSDYSGGRNGKGTWSNPSQALDFCTGNYTYTHPAVSSDGNMMVFASDREGSSGGFDLFLTRKEGESWSAPDNIGRLINTKSNELYPFLDNSDNLYFSSDGHPGYGGYDIFVSRFNGKRWEEPVNLTRLVNSQDDDVAFTLNRLNGKTGFYTSIDNVNKRYAQLYRINFTDNVTSVNFADLSDVFLKRAQSDTTFTHAKLLIARAYDIARAAEDARTAESEKVAKTSVTAKTAEAKRMADEAKAAEIKKMADEARAAEAKRIAAEAKAAEAKRMADEAKAAEAKRIADEARIAEKTKTEPAVKQPVAKSVTVKSITPLSEELRDIVVYRVQFLSSVTQKDIKEVIVDGKKYTPYIYFYLREYRYTAGEFTSLEPAKELQSAMRKAGYPQAFVAAFKNDVRSLDLSLFR